MKSYGKDSAILLVDWHGFYVWCNGNMPFNHSNACDVLHADSVIKGGA